MKRRPTWQQLIRAHFGEAARKHAEIHRISYEDEEGRVLCSKSDRGRLATMVKNGNIRHKWSKK